NWEKKLGDLDIPFEEDGLTDSEKLVFWQGGPYDEIVDIIKSLLAAKEQQTLRECKSTLMGLTLKSDKPYTLCDGVNLIQSKINENSFPKYDPDDSIAGQMTCP